MKPENLLIVADSEHDANMLYAVGVFAPDPFIFLRRHGRDSIVMSDLEIDRARRQTNARVISLTACQKKLQRAGEKKPTFAHVIRLLLREKQIKKVFVPHNFPLGLARELEKLKIRTVPRRGGFFPQREIKSPDEVKKLAAALMMAEVGLAEGIQALKQAKIGRHRNLIYRGASLTSEKLRAIIDTAVLQAGGLAAHTIVAGGKQGCDPHERGFGLLRAHETIILDVFPRSQKTGYFGDITRTVVKGRASQAIHQLYQTVARGQDIACGKIRADMKGKTVHAAVQEFFEKEGYKTGKRNGRMQGFFHGTGHGLGLEIHEAPRISGTAEDTLQAGHVVTIEPGLYYPDLGGVRIEDVAFVTTRGMRNLTRFEKILEI